MSAPVAANDDFIATVTPAVDDGDNDDGNDDEDDVIVNIRRTILLVQIHFFHLCNNPAAVNFWL